LFNLNNGYTLASISLGGLGSNSSSQTAAVSAPNGTLENGVQVVHMTESGHGYSPRSFSLQKGVPVKWLIDAQAPYSCASTILLPQYNIRQSLVVGANTIEFTPTEVGSLRFSCSMGMYTGAFNVVDDNSQSGAIINSALAANSNSATPSGTCGVSASGGGGCGCGGGAKPFVPAVGGVETAPASASNSTTEPETNPQVQNISSTFKVATDIVPNTFKVKVGVPVHYTIDVQETGVGCMSAITIQTLYNQVIPLRAGEPLIMDFTPQAKGSYLITCGMGIPRGKIIVE